MLVSLETLVAWGPAKRVDTAKGGRMLRVAPATEAFWAAWKAGKDALRAAGIGCGRNKSGNWEAQWWQPLPAAEQAAIDAAKAASRAADAALDVPAPPGLDYLPYQRAGIAYAMGRPATLIADEMGLGKTIQAIGIINIDPSIKRVLVVCPASLRLNWARELGKWLVRPMGIAVVNGGKPAEFAASDVTIINYDVVGKHRAAIDAAGPYDLLVIDEAHYLKNPDAKRTKAVYGDKRGAGKIDAKRVVALTGTPIANRPVELFSFLRYADPKGLGKSFGAYGRRYCDAKYTRFGWDYSGASNLDELQDRLRASLMVRRLKSQVLTELPPKRRQIIELPTNGAAAAVAAEAAAMAKNEEVLAQLSAAVELAKAAGDKAAYEDAVKALKAAAAVAFTEMAAKRHEVAVAKVPYVIEHLQNALEGGPVVAFGHHKDVIAGIAAAFAGKCVVVTGDTPMAARQAAVDDFQAGKVPLFIGNIQAAGVGLTLTAASHVVFAELDWVPGNISQAEDRCHRIGQVASVLVQHIVLEGSLDAIIANRVVAKQAVIDAALDNETASLLEMVAMQNEIELPIVPTKHKAATADVSMGQIEAEAKLLTEAQVAAVHLGLRMLAGMCDGARELDGAGFSKIDTLIGHSLAGAAKLSAKQAAFGQRLVRKYRRQIPAGVLEAAGVGK